MMKLLAVAVTLLASASITFGQAAGGGVPGTSSGGGTVTGVTGTTPVVSSGGNAPAISCPTCGVTGSNLSQFASGGAINPASTGATTPGTGAFTTLTSSGLNVATIPTSANFVFDGDSRTCGVGSTSSPACNSIPLNIGTTGYAAVTTGTASSGSTALTVASGTGILQGQLVTGAGIAGNTTVSSVTGTSVTLSLATVAALSTTAVSFGNTDYPSQAMTLAPFSGHGTGYNLGISGQTCAQIANRYAADAHTLSPAVTGNPGYLFVECGTNALGPITPTATGTSGQSTIVVSAVNDLDFGQAVSGTGIGAGAKVASTWTGTTTVPLTVANSGTVSGTITFLASATSIFNSIANVWALGRADGYKIIAETTPIFLTSLPNRQIVELYNDYIRGDKAGWDYMADFSSVFYDYYDPTLFYTDNIHFTNIGYNMQANLAANALVLNAAARPSTEPYYEAWGSGTGNIRLNVSAMNQANTGSNNLAAGEFAGGLCTSCATSFFLGTSAGGQATTSTDAVLIGYLAGGTETSYTSDIFIGRQAGNSATANNDVGIGSFALTSDTGGSNTAIGIGSMALATGGFSIAVGQNAGSSDSTGNSNVFLGQAAGSATTTGSNNIFIGENAQPNAAGDSNEVVVGKGTTGNGTNTTTLGASATTGTYYFGALHGPTARKGTFVCTGAGTITISNANELATSDVVISMNAQGGTITTPPAMKTVTGGTGFTVLCGATDTSTYNYNILN